MKVVLTGSLGNIGKPLTQTLVRQGHAVTVISSKPARVKEIGVLGAKAAIGALEDVNFLTNTFTDANAVYCMLPPFNYLDAEMRPMDEARKFACNYAEAIRKSGVKKVVHLSSIGAHLEKGTGVLAFHHVAEKILGELPEDVTLIHMRPGGFYNNILDLKDMVKGKGFAGLYMTIRYAGLWAAITGKRGVIAANYGAHDVTPWVSPKDISVAIAEELTAPFEGRKVRYVASEDKLSCNDIAREIGVAIGKPYLKWALMPDKDMLRGLKMFGMPQVHAEGLVEMNAAIHRGLLDEDYRRNRPVLGKVKAKDFAQEFASVFNQ